MEFTREKQLCALLGILVLFPALCASAATFTASRASFYGTPDGYGTPSMCSIVFACIFRKNLS